MNIVAIDPSLTSSGWAVTKDGKESVGTIVPPKGVIGCQRLCFIRNFVRDLLYVVEPELVVYEGYSGGKFAAQIFPRAELGGVLKVEFWERKINLLLVPPTSLKMFATGSGAADKDMIRVAMGKHRGTFFKSDDEADAYALLQVGLAFLEPRNRPRDRRHYKHAALRGCELIEAVQVETGFTGP